MPRTTAATMCGSPALAADRLSKLRTPIKLTEPSNQPNQNNTQVSKKPSAPPKMLPGGYPTNPEIPHPFSHSPGSVDLKCKPAPSW